MMAKLTIVLIFAVLIMSVACKDEIFYPLLYEQQKLATRIYCQMEEIEHFEYSSATKLWGEMGGDILLKADVALHCLGDDSGGKYGSQALRYLVEVSNLLIEETKESALQPLRMRPTRGVGEFFSETWGKVKKFFKRVFGGRNSQQDSGTAVVTVRPTDDENNEGEDFNMIDLQLLYDTPFQFVQLANGSIPEIRFAESEDDGRVKNFKRHLVDAFSTQLNFQEKEKAVMETSVMGEHTSQYNIAVSGNENAHLNIAGWGSPAVGMESKASTVTVSKKFTEKDIVRLAPSQAPNDPENMELHLQQTQIFREGKLVSSTGTSSLVLLHDSDKRKDRTKREAEEDVTSYFHSHSTFDVQLKRRQRRSLTTVKRVARQAEITYSPASRHAEVEDSKDKQKMRSLLRSIGDASELFESVLNDKGNDYDEKMQLVFEIVEREVSLKIDQESQSMSNVIRSSLNKEMMQEMCMRNFSACKDFLQLLALAGGSQAEKILLSFLTEDNNLPSTNLRTIADILSDVTPSSSELLSTLSDLIAGNEIDPDVLGSLCLSAGYLASKSDVAGKRKISESFIELLKKRKGRCRSDPLVLDILEAVGNLACENTVLHVLEVSAECEQDVSIQIACTHAIRNFVHLLSVQEWLKNKTEGGDCDLIMAIIGTLLDKIQDQEIAQDTRNWPRFGFNEVDRILRDHLQVSQCSAKDTIRYFGKKKSDEAREISANHFGPESEPWDPGSGSRQKRALWDDLNCKEWTEDSKYNPIQDKEEFASDRATYNKRKSCLAFRRLGVKGANAEIYAGMFAGVKEPSEPPKYKLFTKFVSGLNFLGNQMEIGSFYFYHHNGNTKAYVRIMGRTRQEFTHDGCTPTDLRYRPVRHIPLYLLSVSTVQLSLGIHLSSRLSLDTACPGQEVYRLEPLTDVRIGGEALGNVLFIRGAASLGANFNYKLQFTFTPAPNMCLRGSHGYDPMSVSFESYFQLWNAAKNDWGKTRMWKPNVLSWEVKKGELKSWFDDTCVATENRKPPLNMERELE